MQSMTGSPATSFPFAGSAALTSFIGRRQEIEEAAAQMRTCRLLTLTGPGGVGKTRLAVELARQSQDRYADGVFMADLGSVEEHSGVLPALLAALRVPDQSPRPASEKLIEHLRGKNLLLVLDNCEHLLESTARTVPQLLHQSPALSIIATSREPLGITGEQAYPVPPLGIPGQVLAGGEAMVHSEAVQLLLDRARSIVPDFELTEENQDAIAQLCVQLDGIPLAIELAAPRLRSLSVTELVERLDQRFRLLAGSDRSALPRQKSMSALLGWSYELCTEAEQKLWARISVFPGGFDLAAAEYVCGFDGLESFEVIDLLDRLVSKSIVVVEPDGQRVRYRQLMTFRLYGAGLLDNAEEFEQAKIRQRDFYLQRAAKMVELWCGPGQAACLEAAKQDHPNLISVLEWSLNRPGELRSAASLAALLRYHWIAGGFLNSGRHWLERILVRLDESSLERGNALWVAAWICLIQGDRQAATGFLERCRQEAEQLQDEVLRAHAAHWQALNELFSGRLDAAIALFEQAIATHRDVEDTASMLTAQFQLAMAQSYQGDSLESLKTSDGALELSGERGDRWNHAYSWWIAGVGQFKSGQFSLAQESALKALELQREFKDGICTALSIELLSWIAVEEQQIEHAAVLFQAANCVWKGLGTSVEAFGPGIHADSMRAAEGISARTSTRELAVSRLAGSALGKDAAIELALGRLASVKKSAQRGATQLTKRELEIAGLIEQGMSNRSMASKLVISQRTVDGHVERILNKLGFASRVQVATWSANRRSSPA